MPESSSAEQPVAASAPSPSAPSAPTPSTPPGPPKSTLRQVLEAVVDLAAIAVAGGLAWVGKVDGNVALVVVSLLAGVRVSDLVSAKSTGGSGPAGPGAGGIAGGVLWLLGHLAPRAQHAAGLTVLGLSLALLTGCAGGQPRLSPIAPRLVMRTDYGTCIESGGKLEVPQGPTFALVTQACMMMDAGVPASADASAPEPESDAGAPLPDAIKPGVVALVLDRWAPGVCTVPVFAQGAKTLADLDPVRCAVTAPGDRLTVFRRGSRWVTLR